MDTDELPTLVSDFVGARSNGRALLAEVRRHVAALTRPYPDAWFVLGRKNPEAVDDLSARVFTTCARVPKGRFPFLGREPFRTCVEEDFDGRAIRYHAFYAKLSITRELLRADYAHNVAKDPILAWRFEIYRAVGAALKESAVPVSRGANLLPRWAMPRPTPHLHPDTLIPLLRSHPSRDVAALTRAALELGGPRTQAQIVEVLVGVLDAPAPEPDEAPAPIDPLVRLAVRDAVMTGWERLPEGSRSLLRALASGWSYATIVERLPAFRHKVAITRAVETINKQFLAAVRARLAADASTCEDPKALAELILDVLAEIVDLEEPCAAP